MFTGDTLTTLTNTANGTYTVRSDIEAGREYNIRIAGGGSFKLGVWFFPYPTNTSPESAIEVDPESGIVGGTLSETSSTWYRWKADGSSSTNHRSIRLSEPMDVYTGDPARLLAVSPSSSSFSGGPGVTYYLQAPRLYTNKFYYSPPPSNYWDQFPDFAFSIKFPGIRIISDTMLGPDFVFPDGINVDGVPFTNIVRVRSFAGAIASAVRLHLYERPTYTILFDCTKDPTALARMAVGKDLGVFPLAADPPSSLDEWTTTVGGVASFHGPEFGSRVEAVVERQMGNTWVAEDSSFLLIGAALYPPCVSPGGAIVLNPGSASPGWQRFVEVAPGPSVALQAGGGWRIKSSGTTEIYGDNQFSTNVGIVFLGLSQVTLEFNGVSGFVAPDGVALLATNASSVKLSANYSVLPPKLFIRPDRAVGVVGTPLTSYQVESSSTPTGVWTPYSSLQLLAGTNWILSPIQGVETNRFFRARWLDK